MEYDGRDSVSDILRSNSRAMEEGRTSTTTKGMAGRYYAVGLFDPSANSFIELSLLPELVCSLCLYMPLLLHGTCPCLVARICNGDTSVQQLGAFDIQPNKRRSNRHKGRKK